MHDFINFYKNKKVLITGHSGFKGSWLSNLLDLAGAKVVGLSKRQKNDLHIFHQSKIEKKIKNYYFDIRNKKKLDQLILKEQPEYIFHLAAQSLVPLSINDPYETWSVNLLGTLNIIQSSELLKNTKLILITSDKCYKNNEWLWGYRENDVLGGDDPYSASKAACEMLIHSQRNVVNKRRLNLKFLSARAGNVIGGGDWSEGRIIPDCFKAWKNNKSVIIRNINSTRPWQFVLEPLIGYLKMGILLNKKNILENTFNFGPDVSNDYSVNDLLKCIKGYYPSVKWSNQKNSHIIESNLLKLNSEKSKKILNWSCKLNFEETIKITSDWYFSQIEGKNMEEFTSKQISYYLSIY